MSPRGPMSVSVLVALLVLCCTCLLPTAAHAHARLTFPPPRDLSDAHKDPTGPCGVMRAAGQNVTTLTPGAPVTVTWTETVDHVACFLVDFSAAGDTDFQMLAAVGRQTGPTPRAYSTIVTLPAAPCSGCTVRVRQLMLNREDIPCPPESIPDNITYYSCGNVDLRTPADSGCDCGIAHAPRDVLWFTTIAVVSLVAFARRRW
jgi:hypothetical protein